MFKPLHLRIPSGVIFGPGTISQVGREAKNLGGAKAMLLSGPNVARAGLTEPVFESLEAAGISCFHYDKVEAEPPLHNLAEAVDLAKEGDYDTFIALGGGSCMDLTKMVAAMMTNDGPVSEYFGIDMVPRRGRPTIMIPTTSGTGSEATRISVLTDTEANMKKVVSSHTLLPDLAIVDPVLTLSMPRKVTADTGMDAFIHALEAFLNKGANPIIDDLALQAIRLCARNLGPAFADGSDLEARTHMALASLLGGIAVNNAGVGVMHALSFPIGREYHQAHGPALVVIMAATLESLAVARLDKYRLVAEAFGVDTEGMSPWEAAEAAVEEAVVMARSVQVPTSLTEIGADKKHIPTWAKVAHANRRLLDNTCRDLTVEDIEEILENSF